MLNKKELEKLQREMKNPGFTIVPVRLFINEKGLAKLVIALAKGKKEYDKREAIKEKDDRRDVYKRQKQKRQSLGSQLLRAMVLISV